MNDIEKKLRKRGMAKLDKFAKNPYKVPKLPWYKRIPLWTKVVIPTAALTTALFVVYFNALPGINSNPKNDSKAPGSSAAVSRPTSSKTPGGQSSYFGPQPGGQRWSLLPLNKKFASFDYNGGTYVNSEVSYSDNSYIGAHLDDIVLTATDDIGVDRSIDAGIFTVSYADADQKLALRFSSDNHYYIYSRAYNV